MNLADNSFDNSMSLWGHGCGHSYSRDGEDQGYGGSGYDKGPGGYGYGHDDPETVVAEASVLRTATQEEIIETLTTLRRDVCT